jgi:hypothetical protein
MNAQQQHSDPDVIDETVELGLDGQPLLPPIHELTEEEARQIFDDNAQYYLGISGEEFLRRWDAGEYRNTDYSPDHTAIFQVEILLPLAGRNR